MMDIIFFAVLAIFIFYKLSKELGKIDDEEKKQIEEKIAKQREEILNKVIQHQAQAAQGDQPLLAIDNQNSEKIINELDDNTIRVFVEILQRCNISAEFFLNGAKSAFEMVLKYFAAEDLEALKFLLSEKIYLGFEAAIKQRKEMEQTLITNVIAIESAEIISAMTMENMASVAVKFVSKQINYVVNKDSQIVEGRKDEIVRLIDTWTFKKDMSSPNPNWLVSATSNS